MFPFKNAISLALLLLATPAAMAQAQISLTFEESVQLTAQHNADLRNARANLSAAEYRLRAAYSGYLPQVSGNAGYVDSRVNTTSDATYSAGITATQNLFSGYQDRAKVAQGTANFDSAQATFDATKARLNSDLKSAYAGLIFSQNFVTLTENIQKRLEDNLRLVQLRYESGRENKGSYLITRATLAQGRLDHLQAQQSLVTAQRQLSKVIGHDSAELRATSAVPITEPPSAPDYEELKRGIPDVRDAAAKERSAEADLLLARSGFYPSVNVSGSVGREGDNGYPNGDRRSISANVSIPLYSGGRDISGVRASAAGVDAAKASRESVEQQAAVRLVQTYAVYFQSIEKLNVDREFLEAAQTRADISRARYQNGLMTFEEWDRVESDLIQRQKTFLASQRDRVTAEAAWELAQGKGVLP